MKHRRIELGLSQQQMADATGIHLRQIARYESGESQPSLPTAVQLAEALQLTLDELAGRVHQQAHWSGQWFFAWQRHQVDQVVTQDTGTVFPVTIEQQGCQLHLQGYFRQRFWQAEAHIWHRDALIGWYHGVDKTIPCKGALYYTLNDNPNQAIGHWAGQFFTATTTTGNCTLAKTQSLALQLLSSTAQQSITDDTMESI